MARKKKKEAPKEEEYEFIPPEFDEKEFLETDIRGTKALIVTVLACVVFAIIGYFVGLMHFALGFVVLFAGIFLLRFIYPLAKIPEESLEKKTKAGNYLIFFFLFIGLWVLFLNPPFSDHTDPAIGDPSVWVYDGGLETWIEMTEANRNTLISVNDQVNITVIVTDNDRLERVEISVYRAGDTGQFASMTLNEEGLYEYLASYSISGTYHYTIRAVDGAGNTSELTGETFFVN